MRHVIHAPPAASVNVNIGATTASFPFHSVLLSAEHDARYCARRGVLVRHAGALGMAVHYTQTLISCM